jgi:hypothetical protein
MQRAKQRNRYRRPSRRGGAQPGSRPGSGLLTIVILLVLVLVVLSLVNARDYDHGDFSPAQFGREFTPEVLRGELDYLLKTLEEVHPDLYAFADRSEAARQRARVERELDRPMTRIEFFRLVAPLVAGFGDGHTYAAPPRAEWAEYISQGALLLPVELDFTGEDVLISRNYSSDTLLAAGTQITALNGIPIEQVRDRLLGFVSGEREEWKRQLLSRSFRLLQWHVYGFESPFRITIRRGAPLNDEVERTLLGVTSELIESRRSAALATERPYSYRPAAGLDSVGVLDFNSFRGPKAFAGFLDSTFREIHRSGVRELVLDLRDNGGGNSSLGDSLLAYMSEDPYRQMAQMDVKVSSQIKRYYALNLPWYSRWYPPLFSDFFKALYETPVGEIASFPGTLVQPDPNPLRFREDVYVLINSGTFSSATMLAATVKDYNLGTLVGEETGGLATSYGEVFPFDLPETRLEFGCSSKRFLRPSGEDDGRGVLPDVEAPAVPGGEQDGVLQRALQLIAEQRRPVPGRR